MQISFPNFVFFTVNSPTQENDLKKGKNPSPLFPPQKLQAQIIFLL